MLYKSSRFKARTGPKPHNRKYTSQTRTKRQTHNIVTIILLTLLNHDYNRRVKLILETCSFYLLNK